MAMWRYGIKMTFWFLAMIAIVGLAVMALWNWLIPELFNGNIINYWQALGLLILARLLTGFGKGGVGHWKHKMSRGWSSMSEEDRDKLRAKFKDRWCKSEGE
jgi:ABC-type multidrug transport system fused ATPase/permease subunit